MKKLATLVLALFLVIVLASCNGTKQEATTYYFNGEHEYFEISNGSIVTDGTEQILYSGDFALTQADMFENVASYSVCYYTQKDEEKNVLFAANIQNVNSPTGWNLGECSMRGDKISDAEQALWFELKTTDVNDNEAIYQIQMALTK